MLYTAKINTIQARMPVHVDYRRKCEIRLVSGRSGAPLPPVKILYGAFDHSWAPRVQDSWLRRVPRAYRAWGSSRQYALIIGDGLSFSRLRLTAESVNIDPSLSQPQNRPVAVRGLS